MAFREYPNQEIISLGTDIKFELNGNPWMEINFGFKALTRPKELEFFKGNILSKQIEKFINDLYEKY